MEKSGPPVNYPRMPAEMQEATHSGYVEQPPAAPPSYEQAMHTAPYPPVQVLPTPSSTSDAANRPPTQQQHPAQARTNKTTTTTGGFSAGAQHTYGGSTQYGATSMGGAGGGGGVPPPHHAYMSSASGTTQPMVQQPVVIIQQQAILPLGPEPTFITCPGCHVTKLTRIGYEPNARTHLMAAILCIVGLWCCVCLPYCAESCMSTNHYCGNCNKYLGTYNGGGF
ncbi:lipopolysaccharide-induced tumor necrosis factor-alpha factor [Bactrocera dorsalis]|uniref:Lipopolysaccharide-induced tumor necrosis factor-alpha factor n=1 Tax=Bactrocera dorsalis TaxID=27457 RepID=A0ABM3JCG4_BACDO|nr:lipopolysaccharide-induced tumor necrosis factor-alpha factor [Bactrocera dorsalis]